jgi:hypothetical protein
MKPEAGRAGFSFAKVASSGMRGLGAGVARFGGLADRSVATGLFYDRSQFALIVFVVAAQLVSLPLFLIARQHEDRRSH